MAFTVCKIKNLTGQTTALYEHEFQVDEVFQITDDKRQAWSQNDEVIVAIANQQFEVQTAEGTVSGISKQIEWLKNESPIKTESQTTPLNRFELRGAKSDLTVPANSVRTLDFKIENADGEAFSVRHYFGANIDVVGGDRKDFVKLRVIDKDNVLGYGENVTLKEYADWYVDPILALGGFMTPDGAPGAIPVGCYVSIEYHNVSATEVADMIINHIIGVET